jgi:hypothetical protein
MKKPFYLLLLLFSFASVAQDYHVDLNYFLPKDINYNPEIPTPASIIRHEIGDWHITHDKLVQYMYALADASDRISIENRGFTFEGRPLLLLTITSPANHNSLEKICTDHLALTENNSGNLNTADMPIVVYQGFSIHGNEPSGSNAALAVAYYLAAAQGPKIDEMLANTVILFDPSFNPDGLQRFAYWANSNKSKNINPDPNDREYDEVWPGGRTNHYWFDLNRDWLPVQLPESRARINTFHKWYPNILTDHHEMGTNSTFFFQPGIPSRTHPLTPQKNQDLTGEIGMFHAKALNKIGSLYYSEEDYDDFYYGKGSTFPDINGGIGILFEQASSRGHAQESDNGIITFPFTIRNQFTAALSTLEAAVALRTKILNYQREFFANARKEASVGGDIVFGDEKDATKVYHLAEILQRHKIKFYEIETPFITLKGKVFKKGYSYIIPKNQKQHRLINAMFEIRTQFQDSLFYDISAWSFPLAFNLDFESGKFMGYAGNEVTNLEKNRVSRPSNSNYAYVMEWQDYYSPKALNAILQKGLRAKVAMKPFDLENKSYDYGSILVPVQNQKLNAAEISEFLSEVALNSNVTIVSVNTGLAAGIDLGSNKFRTVKAPKVALLVGEEINSYDAGEIWHLFDQRYDMLLTKLDVKNFGQTDLSNYSDIIVPSSGNILEKEDSEKLKTWVKAGGTLIAYKNSGKWLNSAELLKIDFVKKKDSVQNVSFEEQGAYRGAQVIGGAIFETKLDRSHPIAFGYKNDKLPVFRNSTLFVKADTNSYNNSIQYTDNPLLSGYISKDNLTDLKNTVPFKIGKIGKGKVMYFTDNTNFRAFWYGTNKLLMNAIFFGDEM